MRRILIILILLGSFSAFSQTEIWGVKHLDGANRGGFLYTIDSATGKMLVQHRFLDLYPNYLDDSYMRPFYSNSCNSILFMVKGVLFKFNVLSSDIQEVHIAKNIFGELYELNDTTVYGIYENGIVKINPFTLDFTFIKDNKYTYWRTDVGFQMLDQHQLVFQIEEESNVGKIKVLNTIEDEISDLYEMNTPDVKFRPFGKIQKVGNNFYGALRVVELNDKFFQIYKFNPVNKQFEIILSLKNKYLTDSRMNGLTHLNNDKFYSLAAISENSKELVSFTFNPINKRLDSLAVLPEHISNDIDHSFINLNDSLVLSSNLSDMDFDRGCIFSFNLKTNEFQPILINDSLTNSHRNLLFAKKNEGEIIILKPQHMADEFYKITSYNVIEKEDNWHFDLNELFPYYKGAFPYDIIQLENGNILGTVQKGGNPTSNSPYDLGKGLLFEFDPRTKDYQILQHFDTFDLNNYYPTELFKINDENYIGILHNENIATNLNQGKYLYNSVNKTVKILPFFPWSGLENDYAQIGDSTVFIVPRNANSFNQNSIIKYNLMNDHYDTIVYLSTEFKISNLLLDKNHLVFQGVKNNGAGPDSAFVYQLNLHNNQTTELFCVNEILGETASKTEMSFNYYKDGIIKGNLLIQKSNLDKIVSEIFSINYELDNGNYHIYRTLTYSGGITFVDTDIDYFFNFEEVSNDVFVIRDWSEEHYAGDISIITPDEEIEIIDVFESYYYEFSYGYSGVLFNPHSLKLFQKTDFSKHWIGENSSDWYEASNWFGMQLPDSNDIVTIDAYVNYFPKIDTLVKCKSLVVAPNASLGVEPYGMLEIKEDVFNHGRISYKANDSLKASFIHHKDFAINKSTSYEYLSDTSIKSLISSPMETEGMRFSDNSEIYSFSEEGMNWNPIQNFPFYPEPEKAYFYDQQYRALSFKGDPNYKDYQIEIPFSANNRMYPIPNPYAASLNWTQLDLSQLENKALYRFNMIDSTYVPFVDGLGWESPLIEPLDVIWVYSDGNETVSLQSTDRFHAGIKELEITKPNNELILSASGKGGTDQTIISFNSLASDDFDGDFDAVKPLLKRSDKPSIFTKSTDEYLSINQLPDTAMMELFMEAGERGQYTISIDKHRGFDFVVLEDLIWNRRINLLEQDYSFEYFESDGQYPFKLYFNEWGLEPVDEEDILIYYYPESIYVKSNKQIESAQIFFYDHLGRMVMNLQAEDFHYFVEPVRLPAGHYIVQLRTGEFVVNKKVLVRKSR